jgi:hypothetical protein
MGQYLSYTDNIEVGAIIRKKIDLPDLSMGAGLNPVNGTFRLIFCNVFCQNGSNEA